ncbi:hypothetical protein Pint_26375 [Pistacia integerrima]|uniref:Uncharacterized protein n=1 Tax=Pistacia integerrima TaxID=434235 RepID=A0ACC0YD37_9ROSI|nr:hypothetical protein Pint_26375 [Pistacia integerrima]
MAAKLIISSMVFLIFIFFIRSSTAAFNVITYGAKPDGKTDATPSFLRAWKAACSSVKASTIYVPKGRYLIKEVEFRGPCKSRITLIGFRSSVAPLMLKALASGLAENLAKVAPVGARSITFNWANNVVISGLTSINSQLSHLVINSCNNVMVRNVKLIAPDQSPNTDGIHVQSSTGVTINGGTLQTGDDCISIGPALAVSVRNLNEDGVQNVTLTNAVFTGTLENPIIIDQNYCPNNQGCPRQTSGVKINQVTYRNIQGTSATAEAVTFDCSPSNPCKGIRMHNIKLTYLNKAATSSCKYIDGTSTGVQNPQSCL